MIICSSSITPVTFSCACLFSLHLPRMVHTYPSHPYLTYTTCIGIAQQHHTATRASRETRVDVLVYRIEAETRGTFDAHTPHDRCSPTRVCDLSRMQLCTCPRLVIDVCVYMNSCIMCVVFDAHACFHYRCSPSLSAVVPPSSLPHSPPGPISTPPSHTHACHASSPSHDAAHASIVRMSCVRYKHGVCGRCRR